MALVWVGDGHSGELVDSAAAHVLASDRGLLVGEGVFETLKAVDGQPFALTRHLVRLQQAIETMALPALDSDVVRAAVTQVLDSADASPLSRLRITYTAGSEGRPALIVTAHPMEPWPATTTAVTVPWVRNERSPLAGIKTTSYADNAWMARHASSRGASEAFIANSIGDLCEGTSTNVFVVLDGLVLTPSLASGCLPGVTRELLLEWADVREDSLPYAILAEADEVFVTSSTRNVQPVTRIDDREIPAGELTVELASTFRRRAVEQIDP